jgi:hypothetical protein
MGQVVECLTSKLWDPEFNFLVPLPAKKTGQGEVWKQEDPPTDE